MVFSSETPPRNLERASAVHLASLHGTPLQIILNLELKENCSWQNVGIRYSLNT